MRATHGLILAALAGLSSLLFIPPATATPPPGSDVAALIALVERQQQQIVLLIGELHALRAAMTVDPMGPDPQYEIVIEPQSGVPVLTGSKWVAVQTGSEVVLKQFWRDGKFVPIDVIYNAPRVEPQRMEIFRGGQREQRDFPLRPPRLPVRPAP